MSAAPCVRLHDLADPDAGLVRAWRELADAAAEPNPFFAPDLLLPAAHHLPVGTVVRLATVHRDGALVLAVPLVAGRYRRVPLPAWTTWRHPHRYVGTPLVHPGALDDAPGALLDGLRDGRPDGTGRGPGWLVLEQLYVDGAVSRAFRVAASQRSAAWVEHDPWERPAVRARPQETYLDDSLSPRSAKALRRLRRGLERELGPVRAVDAARGAEPSQVAAEVEAFLAMEAAGWKGRAGTALTSDPAHAAFWRTGCLAAAGAGRLELWRLHAGDAVVARQVHLRAGSTVFHLKTAYDERVGRASPGVQLELDVLRAFHADPSLHLLDPCTEREPGTSARLYPDRRTLADALVGLRPSGRWAVRTTPGAVRAWQRLRRRAGR